MARQGDAWQPYDESCPGLAGCGRRSESVEPRKELRMRAVIIRAIGNIRIEDFSEPIIAGQKDAIVHLTTR